MVDENVKRLLEFDSDNPYKKYILDNPQDDLIIDQINKDFAMQDFPGKKSYMWDKRKEMGEEEWGRILGEDDITRHAEKLKNLYYDMFLASGADQKDFTQSIYDPEWDFDFGEMSDQQLIDFNKAEKSYRDADARYRKRWDPEAYPLKDSRENEYGEVEPTWSDLWGATTGTAYDVWRDQYNLGSVGLGGLLETSPLSLLGLQDYLYDNMYTDESGEMQFEHESDDWWTTSMAKDLGNFIFPTSSVDEDNPYYDRSQRFRWGLDAVPTLLQTYLTKGKGIPAALTSKLPAKGQNIMSQFLPYLSGKGTFWPPRKTGGKWFQRDLIAPSTTRNVALSFMTDPAKTWMNDTGLQAATISDDWGRDSDPVVFDDVMTEKIQNFKPTPRGPGPWNEFKG